MWLNFFDWGHNWYSHWYLIASSLQRIKFKPKGLLKLFLSYTMQFLHLGSGKFNKKKVKGRKKESMKENSFDMMTVKPTENMSVLHLNVSLFKMGVTEFTVYCQGIDLRIYNSHSCIQILNLSVHRHAFQGQSNHSSGTLGKYRAGDLSMKWVRDQFTRSSDMLQAVPIG